MRPRLLALLLLTLLPGPALAQLSISAPPAVPVDGTPFEVHVRVPAVGPEGAEAKVWLGGPGWQASRTWDGTRWVRSDWYVLDLPPGQPWEAWVPVAANPDATNHHRLEEEAVVGLRVRSAAGVDEALAGTEALEVVRHALLALPPGGHASASGEGFTTRRSVPANATDPSVVTVGLPEGFDGQVCVGTTCEPAPARLEAMGRRVAVVGSDQDTSLEGAVLATPAGRCPLAGEVGPQRPLTVAWGWVPDQVGPVQRCQPVGPGAANVSLHHLGTVLDRRRPPPDGWSARLPGDQHRWADRPLPVGTWPAPVEPAWTEGRVIAFPTAREGLERVLEVVEMARDRLTVSTYLLTNQHVADALARAMDRGVSVHLVLEPTPVGGLSDRSARLVERLEARGAHLHWEQGPWNGSGYQHAKVIVADGAVVLVLTENLTHHGLPSWGDGNIGFGLGVANRSVAARVEALFSHAGPWRPLQPEAWWPLATRVAVLSSPENTWMASAVPAWVEASPGPVWGATLTASTSVGGGPNPLLAALANHSLRHPVRVLLDGGPHPERNRDVAAHLLAHPGADDLQVRQTLPGQGRLHAKVLAGPTWAVVGSSNWGTGGLVLNREVNLLVEDPRVAEVVRLELARAWSGPPEGAPWNAVAAPGLALTLAVLGGMGKKRQRETGPKPPGAGYGPTGNGSR